MEKNDDQMSYLLANRNHGASPASGGHSDPNRRRLAASCCSPSGDAAAYCRQPLLVGIGQLPPPPAFPLGKRTLFSPLAVGLCLTCLTLLPNQRRALSNALCRLQERTFRAPERPHCSTSKLPFLRSAPLLRIILYATQSCVEQTWSRRDSI